MGGIVASLITSGVLGAAGSLGSAAMSGGGDKDWRSIEDIQKAYNQALWNIDYAMNQARDQMDPWSKAGTEFALPKLKELIQGGPPKYTIEEFMKEPYVRQALTEGSQAIESSAAARGMLGSGKTMQDISRGTADYVTSAFPSREQQRLNMWITGKLAPLQHLAGMGMQASGNMANIYQNWAGQQAGVRMGQGPQRTSGYPMAEGFGGAMGALQGMMSDYSGYKMFDKFFGGGGGNTPDFTLPFKNPDNF